jgi:hypothetical protein
MATALITPADIVEMQPPDVTLHSPPPSKVHRLVDQVIAALHIMQQFISCETACSAVGNSKLVLLLPEDMSYMLPITSAPVLRLLMPADSTDRRAGSAERSAFGQG